MKGRIVLQDIISPKKGMQVVYDNYILTIRQAIGHLIWVNERDREIQSAFGLKELKQIAVEYEEKIPKTSGFWEDYDIKTLPLHPDDWQIALALIGHELSFELINRYQKKLTSVGNEHLGIFAKLILPTPVRTIEDIPEELRSKYKDSEFFNRKNQDAKEFIEQNGLPDWWPLEETWENIEDECMEWCHSLSESPCPAEVMKWLKQNYHVPKRK